ncbi:hypothetical protein HPB47_020681 [Ixodes persulcatus]|uniref:Uncharacterized protein n=1 Tax=Ixodes persulcatus TaxID=34615 RepID=A0AC60QFL9_IXOPE|nr:hypothetical protein HPB47_020681 [Ixodes persulcatus]
MRDEQDKDAEEVTADFDEDSGRTLDQNGGQCIHMVQTAQKVCTVLQGLRRSGPPTGRLLAPGTNQCPRCGEKVTPEGNECRPRCKICDQPHETASKECKRRLKPGPPPLHVREKNASGNQEVTWNA